MGNDAFQYSEGGPGKESRTDENDIEHNFYEHEAMFEWLYPTNVADVEALIIGNTTIPVN